jgi:arylsulfatase A-like enzyme
MAVRHLPRRDFLKALGAAAIAGPAILRRPVRGAVTNRKLNVVMMVADDQRHDTIAALGNDHIQTPHLDRLTRDGFAFTRARCMGSQQGAVCVPSRAMLHTGRTLFRVPDNIGQFPMLGEVLQGAGYTSFGCGKWHNGPQSFARGFNAGGNIFFGGMHDQYNTPVHDYSPDGNYPAKSQHAGSKFSSELFADAAVDFLGHQKSSEKPFFCYLAFTSPHDPRTPPAPYKTMYDPKAIPLPANFLPEHPFDNGEMKVRDEMLAPFPRTPADTRRQLCDYYGMVSSQDAQVGRVLAALEESGQAENTIVIYTGDHGLAIGSHGLFGKQNVYEHSASIPLIMTGPSIPRGGRSDALVYGFDIFPTLCEMLNIKSPGGIEGKSLRRITGGRETLVRDSAFHAYIHHNKAAHTADTQHAVNDGRWKYIRYDVRGKMRVQLFDLQADPAEIHDLSADLAASKELPRTAALLTRWQSDLGEPSFT